MLFRRFGRPGLLGLAARTAVVAGTASAVGGALANRRERAAQERAEADAYEVQQAAPAAAPVAEPAPAGDDLMAELERLGRLREQGLLNDEEFAAAKGRLLATGPR